MRPPGLSEESLSLLVALAPFRGVFASEYSQRYTTHLRHRPELRGLDFDGWEDAIAEAIATGMLTPDKRATQFLRIDPEFHEDIRRRLGTTENQEIRIAIQIAFRNYYHDFAQVLIDLQESDEKDRRREGREFARLEEENLTDAIRISLTGQLSVKTPFLAISGYLDQALQHDRAADLGREILEALAGCPPEKLAGRLGLEYLHVLDRIAYHQRAVRRLDEADHTFRRAQTINLGLTEVPPKQVLDGAGSLWERLGEVAEQRQRFDEARDHYLQALAAFHELRSPPRVSPLLRKLSSYYHERNDQEVARGVKRIFGVDPKELLSE